MLNSLTADGFCMREAVAAKEHSTLAEVRRLCSHPGDEGRGCEAHHLSDGKFSGAMAGKGIVAASVVASREALVQWAEDEAEVFLGDTLAGQAGQGLNDLAVGIVTTSLKATEVIKMLGAHSASRSTMGGRTIWGASRFGATTGGSWQEDYVQAMGRLGIILYDVYVVACSYPAAGVDGEPVAHRLVAARLLGQLAPTGAPRREAGVRRLECEEVLLVGAGETLGEAEVALRHEALRPVGGGRHAHLEAAGLASRSKGPPLMSATSGSKRSRSTGTKSPYTFLVSSADARSL